MALLTKETPRAVRRGFPRDDEEAQRRIIIMAEIPAPLGNVTVINGYSRRVKKPRPSDKIPGKKRSFIRICKTTWKPNSNVIIRY